MTEKFKQVIAWGQAETVASAQDLLDKAKRGDLSCVAMRQFKADGTFEDVVIGGTADERAETLAAFKKMYAQAN